MKANTFDPSLSCDVYGFAILLSRQVEDQTQKVCQESKVLAQ